MMLLKKKLASLLGCPFLWLVFRGRLRCKEVRKWMDGVSALSVHVCHV